MDEEMTTKADAYLPTERGHGRELKIEEGWSKNKGGGVPHLCFHILRTSGLTSIKLEQCN